jgi:hypothetical protein
LETPQIIYGTPKLLYPYENFDNGTFHLIFPEL